LAKREFERITHLFVTGCGKDRRHRLDDFITVKDSDLLVAVFRKSSRPSMISMFRRSMITAVTCGGIS
jgi:hypothetical protein